MSNVQRVHQEYDSRFHECRTTLHAEEMGQPFYSLSITMSRTALRFAASISVAEKCISQAVRTIEARYNSVLLSRYRVPFIVADRKGMCHDGPYVCTASGALVVDLLAALKATAEIPPDKYKHARTAAVVNSRERFKSVVDASAAEALVALKEGVFFEHDTPFCSQDDIEDSKVTLPTSAPCHVQSLFSRPPRTMGGGQAVERRIIVDTVDVVHSAWQLVMYSVSTHRLLTDLNCQAAVDAIRAEVSRDENVDVLDFIVRLPRMSDFNVRTPADGLMCSPGEFRRETENLSVLRTPQLPCSARTASSTELSTVYNVVSVLVEPHDVPAYSLDVLEDFSMWCLGILSHRVLIAFF